MKCILTIVVCLVLSLASCNGRLASEFKNNDTASGLKANGKTAVEQSEKAAGNSSYDFTQEDTQEMVIETGIGEDGGNVTVKTGGNIAWDPEKVGGLPQPVGVAVFMEMDMSEILGKNFAYSYSVTGLTKEGFQQYIKIASDTFPKVIENTLSDAEGIFIAATEDNEKRFHVRFIEGDISFIQYIN